MEVSIIQIGNSKGIRLAKTILERYDFTDKVELIFKEGFLILRPVKQARDGWDKAFKKMAERGDDGLLIDDIFEDKNWD